ncbi:Polygalacturonase-like protein, partial [Drosera capensis]
MALPLLITILLLPSLSFATNYNAVSYGAKPDGNTDSSAAFLNMWNAACSSVSPSTIIVPAGKFLVAQPVVFSGDYCKSRGITFRILGTLVAPSNYQVFAKASYWISFIDVSRVTISGGTLDGQGAGLWTCKNNGGNNCPGGVTTLAFTNSKNIVISGLTSLNSQLYHIVVNGCQNVNIHGVKVIASGASPNTDGIHVQLSSEITILNTNIGTGDDCISIGPGTTNMWMQKVVCGPGHGISIGSLGKDANEAGVRNVTVTSSTFVGTQNGVRIKTWARPSNGFVTDVHFQHLTMVNAQNPIIIDQNYCPNDSGCPGLISGVKISDVTYLDIHGTSATEVAVNLDCSSKYPCSQITLQDVQLTYNDRAPLASCLNAGVSSSGLVQPTSC